MTTPPDEPALLRRLANGEKPAFLEVYALYRVALFSFLWRLCGRHPVAEDLFQRTWMKLLRAAPKLRPDSDLKAWLFTVARNEHRSYRRWRLLDASRVMLWGLSQSGTNDVVRPTVDLEQALSSLSIADRETLLLAADGFDAEAAARVLEISAPTYRKRLSRARQRLAEVLEREVLEREALDPETREPP